MNISIISIPQFRVGILFYPAFAFLHCKGFFFLYNCFISFFLHYRLSFWYSRYLFTLLFITAVPFYFLYTWELFCHPYGRPVVRRHLALCSWMLPHQCDVSCQNLWLPVREVYHGKHHFFFLLFLWFNDKKKTLKTMCGSSTVRRSSLNVGAHFVLEI